MEQIFEDIKNLVEKDSYISNSNIKDHLNKLTEEVGELAKEVNKLTGRKTTNEDTPTITRELAKEAADVIQCTIAICVKARINYNELLHALHEKNGDYNSFIDNLYVE